MEKVTIPDKTCQTPGKNVGKRLRTHNTLREKRRRGEGPVWGQEFSFLLSGKRKERKTVLNEPSKGSEKGDCRRWGEDQVSHLSTDAEGGQPWSVSGIHLSVDGENDFIIST